ncbi:hypothetical protein [Nocardia aurantia]|uniref:Uncharacterized protein n=1 Tax=Nocardia aurantia TaxID=2585199 RepID=A0A7K0DR33_9NOCA|nr:hypothetical protein [Nocardia aurantia]MQY28223.1 hypothetical protein [Nocardia aurantia]
MVDRLDIDEATEVVLAAAKFTGAATTYTGKVSDTVDGLTVPARADSPLDRDLVGKLDWIVSSFGGSVTTDDGRSDTILLDAVKAVDALAGTDILGGLVVTDTEPV